MLDELEAIVRAGRRRPLYMPALPHRVALGREAIEALIPHRAPFLFVDRIDAVDRVGGHIAGHRRLDPDDPVFRGHFPGAPIYPGVLQVEMIGQLGLCLLALGGTGTMHVRALKLHHATFLVPLAPGAELVVLAKALASDDTTALCAGQVICGDAIACVAAMEVYFVEA